MKAEFRKIEELREHEMNPKIHTEEQVEAIAKNLRFSQYQPVVIDKKGVVLAGWGTVKALQKIGKERVLVEVMESDNEVEKLAYLLADNQLAAMTDIDTLKEQAIHRQMKERGYDVSFFGQGYEMAPSPEVVEQGAGESYQARGSDEGLGQSIAQTVVVFDSDTFDMVMKKFDLIMKKETDLKDNTEVFVMLLGHIEKGLGYEAY